MIGRALQPLPLPDVDPDTARQRAGDILSRAEYSNSESILDRLGRWLDELLNGLFEALGGGGVGGVIGWLLLGGLAGLAVYLLARMGPVMGRRRPGGTAAVVVEPRARDDDPRTAHQWRADADLLTAEGRFDEALRARYRALLCDLVAAGQIADVAGRTPGEYRRELVERGAPSADRFAAATDQFELVWYGAVDADADDLAAFIRHEHAVLGAVTA